MFGDLIASSTLTASQKWSDSVSGGASIDADDKTWSASIVKA